MRDALRVDGYWRKGVAWGAVIIGGAMVMDVVDDDDPPSKPTDSSVVVDPQNTPGDIDCWQIDGPVWVGDYDPNGLDGDNDGWGCET